MESAPAAEYRFPDFLGIGAQKAGTSWLHRNLRRHPDLWLPLVKEVHYFNELYVPEDRKWTGRHRRDRGLQMLHRYLDKTARENWNCRHIARLAEFVDSPVSDDWYGRIFGLAGAEQICGEITPDYATIPPEGIRHILKLSPKVKIILSLRDPIERCWSHVRMTAQTRQTADLAKIEDMAGHIGVLKRADYPAMIAKWRKSVPGDRFQVVFMDDIIARPQFVLENICDFLGVEFVAARFAKASAPVHVGQKLDMPPSVHAILKERLRPVYDGIAALYPAIGAEWASRHY